MPNTVLVVGAQGTIGSFISRLFAEAGWKVFRAGRRPESAPDFRLINLGDPSGLKGAVAEADLVISTAHHPDLPLERTILREDGTLIDLIELSPGERNALDAESRDAQGLVISDTGLGGVGYMAIADLLRAHPDADQAEYSLMASSSGSSGHAGALFAHSLLTGSSHHPTAKLPFPKPPGTRRCIEVGAAGGVLRDAVNGVPLRSYILLQPRPLHSFLLALNAARLISKLPSASFTAGTGKVPDELSEEPICEWAAVEKGGRRLAARTIEGKGYYRMTAGATLAFGETLIASPTERRGLLSIDQLLPLDAVLPRLERRGVFVREQAVEEKEG
jgi:hypothetical protein